MVYEFFQRNACEKRPQREFNRYEENQTINGKEGLPSEGKLVEEGTAKVFFQGDVFYNLCKCSS